MRTRFRVGEGMIGRAAASGEPYLSDASDADRYLSEFVTRERVESFVHIPITLGPRLFGVLNLSSDRPGWFDPARLDLAVAFARAAAGAIANALHFQRERRIAHALTRGFFVPGPAPSLPGLQIGLVYEPAGHDVGGGDIFGAWTMPSGASAVLIGDVEGKGPRGRRAQLDGALLRRGAHVGLREPGRGARPDRGAAAPPAAERELCVGVHERHRDGRLRYANAARIITALSAAGGEQVLTATGSRSACRTAPGRRRRSRSRSVMCCSRPPTGSPRPAARARSSAPRDSRPARRARAPARPGGARRARAPRARGVGAELDDDVVILAVRRC